MERPSEASQSRGSTWKGLLIITASILSCWSQPTSAQDLTVVPEPAYGKEGDTVTLVVRGFSGTPLSYTWYTKLSAEDPKDTEMVRYIVSNSMQTPNDIRQRVFPNGSLLIPNLVLNDTKYYTVQMVDTIGNILRGGAQLTVYAPLSKPTIVTSNITAVETKDFSLTCQAEGQIDTYRWFINESAPTGERIQLSQDNKTLTINNITRKDEGLYVCQIENLFYSNRSDPFPLNVTYGPDTPTITPTFDHYPIGADITLNCSAESNPPAQFTWFHNGQNLSDSAILSITNVSLNHTGTYTCHASNSYTGLNSTKDKNITIYENLMKPNITINSASNIMENDTVVLTCNTENGNIVGTRWYFKNEKLILNDRMNLSQDNKTLTIMPVKGEDNGDYQCEIWNPIGTNRSDSFHLVVIYGPEEIKLYPNSVNGQIEVTFNENLTLGCEAKSQPPAQYTWQINGSSISGNSGNNYTIYQASWKHEGTYTCMAVNNVTKATISTQNTVKVVEKMDPSGGGSSLSGGAIAGIVIGVLAGVALIGALVYCLFFRKSAGASDHHPTEHKSSAPNHSHLKSDRPPNGTEEVSYASVNFNAQKSSATVQAPTPTETIYSEIKKK